MNGWQLDRGKLAKMPMKFIVTGQAAAYSLPIPPMKRSTAPACALQPSHPKQPTGVRALEKRAANPLRKDAV